MHLSSVPSFFSCFFDTYQQATRQLQEFYLQTQPKLSLAECELEDAVQVTARSIANQKRYVLLIAYIPA